MFCCPRAWMFSCWRPLRCVPRVISRHHLPFLACHALLACTAAHRLPQHAHVQCWKLQSWLIRRSQLHRLHRLHPGIFHTIGCHSLYCMPCWLVQQSVICGIMQCVQRWKLQSFSVLRLQFMLGRIIQSRQLVCLCHLWRWIVCIKYFHTLLNMCCRLIQRRQ